MSDVMSTSLDAVLDSVVEIVKYHEEKTSYECDCKVREKVAELRRVEAGKRAEAQRELTVQIKRWEFKLDCINALLIRDNVSKTLWTPFCEEVERFIAEMKHNRKAF